MTDPAPGSPREADVVAADGGTFHLRPIQPGDADALVRFHAGLSQRTRYLRFFTAYPRIPERDLFRFTNVDHHNREALVAELSGTLIAVGRYERAAGSDEAEVAFVVADEHQGRGIGSVLLEHLAAIGREEGIARFTAQVLAENSAMIRVFRDAGYETTRHIEYGEVSLEFAIGETAMTEAVMREREQRAEARSIGRLLAPRSVAVIGASNDQNKIGNALVRNLLRMGFDGPLYPVNPDARHVHGVPAYPTVLDVPDELDLAVVAVPAASVPAVVEQCARRGVHGLVITSGGFGERGDAAEQEAGRDAQRDLVGHARAHGMRVVGPNCLGVINTDAAVQLNASLAPLPPLTGRAGFFCQSGALGVAVLGEAARRGLGISTFVSAGNRADVSGNDLLQFWEQDERTDVVLMHLESFGNPRKFARLARRLGRSKPIVAVKAGAGAVVPGLAGTSVAVPEDTVQALLEASGVIRVQTVGDLFDVGLLLTTQPLPPGDRVAVVGNSTALGVLVSNACAEEGLALTRLVDLGVDASPQELGEGLAAATEAPDVDAVVAVFVPPLQPTSVDEFALALRSAVEGRDKPVVSTFLGFDGVPAALAGTSGEGSPPRGSVPSYPTPERAVRALARAVRHSQWRRRPVGSEPELLDFDIEAARAIVRPALAVAGGAPVELSLLQVSRLLAAIGIPLSDGVPRATQVVFTVRDDPSFGALVSFGIGGVATELLADRAFAVAPLTTTDAEALIAAPRAAPMLTGWGGAPVADQAALSNLALRLSALADELPEIAECVVRASAATDGAHVTAATVRLAPPTVRGDTGPRRLRGL